MFIEPKYKKIKLKDGDSLINPVINLGLCKYFSLISYEHKTHDENLKYESIMLPSIVFEGCNISWVFNCQTDQREEYQRLINELT